MDLKIISFQGRPPKFDITKQELQELTKHKSCLQIAKMYDVEPGSVSYALKKFKLPTPKFIKKQAQNKILSQKIPELIQKEATLKQMEKETGIDQCNIIRWIQNNSRQKSKDVRKMNKKALFLKGLSDPEIAKITGLSEDTVTNLRYKLGFNRKIVTDNKHKKLADAIFEKGVEGKKPSEIAEELNVCRNTVYNHIRMYNLREKIKKARAVIAEADKGTPKAST